MEHRLTSFAVSISALQRGSCTVKGCPCPLEDAAHRLEQRGSHGRPLAALPLQVEVELCQGHSLHGSEGLITDSKAAIRVARPCLFVNARHVHWPDASRHALTSRSTAAELPKVVLDPEGGPCSSTTMSSAVQSLQRLEQIQIPHPS